MGTRKTTEEFIEKAKEIHSNKYDYSLVEYKNQYKKVKIICKEHGIFEQIPKVHLKGSGCKKCGKHYSPTTEEFIEKANKVHNNKFDYSKTIYNGTDIQTEIICKKHGSFFQTPHIHIKGGGCPKCANKNVTTEEFIERANQIHNNKYDYSLVEYKGAFDKIKIICKEHGSFEQKASYHLNGNGCPKCGKEKVGFSKRLIEKEFLKRAIEINGDTYDYSLVEYKDLITKVKIICKEHGIFEQTPHAHIYSKSGCPVCKKSKGEKEITNVLLKNNIKFISQKWFKECRGIKFPLPFDFYLPDYNMLIEFQGRQHYEPVNAFGGINGFEKVQRTDQIKKQYCQDNNITLLEIRYDEDIEQRLSTILKS